MADSYIDNNSGSKKKYLIPLVVLMICAVSLTGAGYAYSNNAATLDVSNDDLGAETLTLDFADNATATAYYATKAVEVIDFYDHPVYAKDGSRTNQVSWAAADSQTADGAKAVEVNGTKVVPVALNSLSLKVTTTSGNNSSAGTAAVVADKLMVKVTVDTEKICDVDLNKMIKSFTVAVTGATADTTYIMDYSADTTEVLTFTITTPATASTPASLTVTVSANVIDGNTGADVSKTASDFAAAFESMTISYDFIAYENGANTAPAY